MYEKGLVGLCREAVSGTRSGTELPAGSQIEFLRFCLQHKLENIVYYALQQSHGTFSDKKTEVLFKDKYNQAILNDASQQYYMDIKYQYLLTDEDQQRDTAS